MKMGVPLVIGNVKESGHKLLIKMLNMTIIPEPYIRIYKTTILCQIDHDIYNLTLSKMKRSK